MNQEKLNIMKNKEGFIAALDQSGGSSAKTLKNYGILESDYNTDEEMFDLIHEMRTRVMISKNFTNEKVLGVILFEDTMNRKILNKLTSDYLWEDKQILSFLKIDKGLEEEQNGVQLMKDIPNLTELLKKAHDLGIFGTKMRSVIHSYNETGIKKIVKQQFDLAKIIYNNGLIPIIEPEVSIDSKDKEKCEELLKKEVLRYLDEIDFEVVFKFTIPTIDNYYSDIIENKKVIRVVALSGGYKREDACLKLSRNHNMIASFSRALLENLKVSDTDQEFDSKLAESIDKIYKASIQ